MTDIRKRFVAADDGTSLFVDDRGPTDSPLVPLLCLPGLTRNSRDFEPVQDRLAERRRIISLDFRGRGRSGHAADPSTYRPDVELADTLKILDRLGVSKVALLGTSRGGIVGMVMAATARERLAGLCLNDIGAALEPQGLLRIMDYVGRPVTLANWEEAAHRMAALSYGFSGVGHSTWQTVSRRILEEHDGAIRHSHDLRLAESLPARELVEVGQIADLWALMPALLGLPVALLRGEGSDLLSRATADKMIAALPDLQFTEIPGRGHVPFLDEPESIAAIDRWLATVDGGATTA